MSDINEYEKFGIVSVKGIEGRTLRFEKEAARGFTINVYKSDGSMYGFAEVPGEDLRTFAAGILEHLDKPTAPPTAPGRYVTEGARYGTIFTLKADGKWYLDGGETKIFRPLDYFEGCEFFRLEKYYG
jgi:hypothetical protein